MMLTLQYQTDVTGRVETVEHPTTNRRIIELIGRSLVQRAEKGTVWDIAVLDEDRSDVTFDFECFQG